MSHSTCSLDFWSTQGTFTSGISGRRRSVLEGTARAHHVPTGSLLRTRVHLEDRVVPIPDVPCSIFLQGLLILLVSTTIYFRYVFSYFFSPSLVMLVTLSQNLKKHGRIPTGYETTVPTGRVSSYESSWDRGWVTYGIVGKGTVQCWFLQRSVTVTGDPTY